MTKYIVEFDGAEHKFSSNRLITHAVVTHGQRCDGKVFDAGIMNTVSRADLVAAAVRKAQKLFKPENVRVFEVREEPSLVTREFKRGIDSLLGLR